jgi:hypothetical protein
MSKKIFVFALMAILYTAMAVSAMPTGNLTVTSDPSGAKVYVNLIYRGLSPITVNDLEAKDMVVGITKPGYDMCSFTIKIEAGKTVYGACNPILTPSPTPASGKDGKDGKDGKNGINGVTMVSVTPGTIPYTFDWLFSDGYNYTTPNLRGEPGIDGTSGTNGLNGIDGTNGTNGLNGIDGTNGTNGLNGIDGTNGANGLDGINGVSGWERISENADVTVVHHSHSPDTHTYGKTVVISCSPGRNILSGGSASPSASSYPSADNEWTVTRDEANAQWSAYAICAIVEIHT